MRVVSSGGETITVPMSGAPEANPACPAAAPSPGEAVENPRSTGIVLRFGQFRFVDLGDLSGRPLFALFCPNNLLGHASVYLVPHHGGSDVVYPATFAVRPRVAIMNNGETKGGSADAFAGAAARAGPSRRLAAAQVARRRRAEFADANVANLDETTGHWIKVSADESGTFSVTNARTGETRKY